MNEVKVNFFKNYIQNSIWCTIFKYMLIKYSKEKKILRSNQNIFLRVITNGIFCFGYNKLSNGTCQMQ
jgi:hypothetical protein